MRWFKHLTSAGTDEKITRLIEKAGMEGYGFYWRMIEIIASQVSDGDKTSEVTYGLSTLGRLCYLHPNKVRYMLDVVGGIGGDTPLMLVRRIEHQGDTLYKISCPNILKYRDEYSQRRGRERKNSSSKCRESVGTISGECPEQDTDTEAETEKSTKKDTSPQKNAASFSPEFLSFWEAYPKKVDKALSWKSWGKQVGEKNLSRIMQALKNYQEHVKKSGEYVRNPATFINRDWPQWLEKPEAQSAKPTRLKNTFED